jgi:translocation and assembly module TamA
MDIDSMDENYFNRVLPGSFGKSILATLACLILNLAFTSTLHAETVLYVVDLKDFDNSDIHKTMSASSNLIQLREKPLSSSVALISRARTDKTRFLNVLKSFGYFKGKVQIRIEGKALGDVRPDFLRSIKKEIQVAIEVDPGPLYVFGEVTVAGLAGEGLKDMVLELELGTSARGDAVLTAERDIVTRMRLKGYPYAKMGDRKLTINHEQKVLKLKSLALPGPLTPLGELDINGNERVETDFISKYIPWQVGDIYDPRILEGLRSDLSKLGIFSSIKVKIADLSEDDIPEGEDFPTAKIAPMDVMLMLEERERRFIGFGADYSTTEGIGINAFWGHRNLFGRGEKLKISARVARIGENDPDDLDTSLKLAFRKPYIFVKGQDLLFDMSLIEEHPDAFDRRAFAVDIGLERRVTKTLSFTGGVSAEFSEIIDNDGKEDEFFLIGIPLSLKHDTTDDLLDPKRGMRNQVFVIPYFPLAGNGEAFTTTRIVSRAYYDVTDHGGFVVAGRVVVGSTIGGSLLDTPSDKRFFSGGGGSVRGYEYQKIGPLDADGNPIGGRSLLELGLEFRLRYKNFGIVPFIDGGSVGNSDWPDFDEKFQWAAGLGLRYYTAFGPIRADIAIPLNKREGDDSYAYYISIGQAF